MTCISAVTLAKPHDPTSFVRGSLHCQQSPKPFARYIVRFHDDCSSALKAWNCSFGVAAFNCSISPTRRSSSWISALRYLISIFWCLTSVSNRPTACLRASTAIAPASVSVMGHLQYILGLGQLRHDRGAGQPVLNVLNNNLSHLGDG